MTSNKTRRELIKNKFGVEFKDLEYIKHFVIESQKFYKHSGKPMAMIPEEVILDWANFIEHCEAGYSDIPPEFDNDLDIARAEIDPMLESKLLTKYQEHSTFNSIINQLDERFKEITFEVKRLPEEWKWWKKRVLKKAGEDYANFMNWNEVYGLKVEVIN